MCGHWIELFVTLDIVLQLRANLSFDCFRNCDSFFSSHSANGGKHAGDAGEYSGDQLRVPWLTHDM